MSPFTRSIPQGKIVLTYDDYRLLPNDRKRYEIVDGELSVTPAPATMHQAALGNLYRFLANYVVAHQLGKLFIAPIELSLLPLLLSNRTSSLSALIVSTLLQSGPSKGLRR